MDNVTIAAIVGAVALVALAIVGVFVLLRMARLREQLAALTENTDARLSDQQRAVLAEVNRGLLDQSQRLLDSQRSASLELATTVSTELARTRDATQTLTRTQVEELTKNRDALTERLANAASDMQRRQDALKGDLTQKTLEQLAESSRADQQLIQDTMRHVSLRITDAVTELTGRIDARLAEIGGKVNERLEEGFKKTNETFVNVMTRLATIDEAQKKIEGLTSNVVSLQQLLGDKRARGALGERQLEDIVRNMLPETAFEFQYSFQTVRGVRADCVLKLPAPTGLVAVDSKFPLENFERMLSDGADRVTPAVFKADVKKHVDDIAAKYIIPGETSDGAVMFVPAEAVFAEIHAHHRDVVEYAAQRRVWIVSPTTLMAVLNTARAVLKDVETRRQIHIIKDELGKLGQEFGRFQSRMDDLARHIGQAKDDVDKIHTTSRKISAQFAKIERAELDEPEEAPPLPQRPSVAPGSLN